MSDQAELPKGHPMRDAWEAYSATDKYANTRNWALNPNHVDGSLWAAFIAGYAAAPPAEAPGEVPWYQPIDFDVILRARNWSPESIAELSPLFAEHCQAAFNKGRQLAAAPAGAFGCGNCDTDPPCRDRCARETLRAAMAAPAAPAISVEVYSIHEGVGTFNCPDFVKVGDKLYTAPRVTGGRADAAADLAELAYWRNSEAKVMGHRSQVDGLTHRERIAEIRRAALATFAEGDE